MLRHALAIAAFAIASIAQAAAPVGKPAPDIELADTSGKPVKLADFRGRYVVLEWLNPGCPFVQKHYTSGNMQSLARDYGAKNVAWLAVNSTRPGHPDYMKPAELGAWVRAQNGAAQAVLMDPDGKVGRAYDARVTPHMFIVDPAGIVIYNGAIDDKRSANPADAKTANNFVRAALGEAMAGRPVKTATTQPYGCTVKY
jgi:hypothetical protein